jgi:hypothetical protein
VVANRRVAGVGERESTWGTRMREPDDLVLHLVEREGVAIVDVCEKLFVCLLVAGGFGEVEAHESDEGVDVLDGHGLHVAELRSRGVDRSDVVKTRSHGVILEAETRLEATSEELVRDSRALERPPGRFTKDSSLSRCAGLLLAHLSFFYSVGFFGRSDLRGLEHR